MKKIFTFAFALGLTVASYAQVQRMVLSEEFTNASCGPCASQNPAYNTLMDANSTKVITLKYQTVWPGVDPMNAQNQADVATRVTYYGVNGVPYAPMDGDTNITGPQAYNGAPFNYNQAMIDARYAVPAHWTISLTHHLSSDLDSVYITCVVTPDGTNPSITGLKLHIALIEKEINFNAAPGTNGEKDFYNVMRKMYPSAAGQSVVAGSHTYTVAEALPSYLYNANQVGVVAFIQNNTHSGTAWPVQQAAISQPQAVSNYASLSSVQSFLTTCANTSTPTIRVKNLGTSLLTSATINYSINGGANQTQPWSGTLPTNATQNVVLSNSLSLVSGVNTVQFYLSNVNQTAISTIANPSTSIINKVSPISGTGYSESCNAVLPSGWFVNNPDAGASFTRVTTSGYGTPLGALRMYFYNSPPGAIDEVSMPAFDLSGLTTAQLKFKRAHSQYDNGGGQLSNDSIIFAASTDCGLTWTNLWLKSGSSLATVAASTTSYVANTNAAFVQDSINLNFAAGNSSVLVKIIAHSDYGNNAFFDDFNIVSNTNSSSFASSNTTCSNSANGSATASGMFGTSPYSYSWSNGATTQTISNLVAGTYTCTITDANSSTQQVTAIITSPTAVSVNLSSLSNTSNTNPSGSISSSMTGGTPPYTCSWTNVPSAQSSNPSVGGLAAGSYTIVVTDANGCTASSQIAVVSTVGINETVLNNNATLLFYPNPFTDNATLKLNISKSENVSYTLVSAMGAVVGSENKGKLQAGESLITIDGSNLAAGIYLMNVTVGNKTYSQKLNIVK